MVFYTSICMQCCVGCYSWPNRNNYYISEEVKVNAFDISDEYLVFDKFNGCTMLRV